MSGHITLLGEIESIQSRLAECEEVLRFYADRSIYRIKRDGIRLALPHSDLEKGVLSCGGKRAREYFAKFKEKE